MSRWKSAELSVPVWINNQSRSLQVATAFDEESELPSKIAIYEQAGQKSELFREGGLSQAIGQVCTRLGIEPQDAEWYAMDDKKEIFKVEVESQTTVRADARLNAVRSDMPSSTLDEVSRAFPKVEVEELKTSLTSVEPQELKEMDTWFNSERVNPSELSPAEQYSEQEWMEASISRNPEPAPDPSERP